MSGEQLSPGDFGVIKFTVDKRVCSKANGKLSYTIESRQLTFEGVEVTDADKSRIYIEGIDKSIPEVFNILRSNVVSFEKMDKPK